MKPDSESYEAAAAGYRNTVKALAKEVAALKRPDKRTRKVVGKINVQMSKKIETLAPFLPRKRRERLEEIYMSFLEFDDEGEFDGKRLYDPKVIVTSFMNVFSKAKI
jgi:hypothetical protein